jgi:hypothetical protein
MKFIFTLLCLFSTWTVYGETIGDVEYQLPEQISQEWAISKKIESKRGTTIVWCPKSAEVKEFFGVHANQLATHLDTASFKEMFSKMLPSAHVDVQILEKTDSSVLFEWTATENEQQMVYGLHRAFATAEGTVVLGYQIEDKIDVAKAKDLWLPVLKDAHLVK